MKSAASTENSVYGKFSESFGHILKLERVQSIHLNALMNIDEELLLKFVRALFPEFKNNPSAEDRFSDFLEVVYTSGVGVVDWVWHITAVYHWLACNKKKARFTDVVQYVSCYLESNSCETVHTFLETYGFERTM